MTRLSIITIEEQANQLRAEEMRRVHGLVCARLGGGCRQLCTVVLFVLTAISEGLRPFFSWNPRARNSRKTPAGYGVA